MEMRMETGVWGSQKGQGATWMYWSDMMELKLINGCCMSGGDTGEERWSDGRSGVDVITG